jgi:L-amino acid N-acyltransferase YncA
MESTIRFIQKTNTKQVLKYYAPHINSTTICSDTRIADFDEFADRIDKITKF